MKPGQELVILLLFLFIGVVAVVLMQSVILNRLQKLQKQKQHRSTVKHTHFYARLPEFIGGQILFSYGNLDERTGIIKDIRLSKETKNEGIDFSCLWTAESKRIKRKWTPCFSSDGRYFNLLNNETLFDVDRAAIFELTDKVFCLIMSNAQGVVFLYPKSEYIIKLEDVEEYEVMLPAITRLKHYLG